MPRLGVGGYNLQFYSITSQSAAAINIIPTFSFHLNLLCFPWMNKWGIFIKHCYAWAPSKQSTFIQRAAKYSTGAKNLEYNLGCAVKFIFNSGKYSTILPNTCPPHTHTRIHPGFSKNLSSLRRQPLQNIVCWPHTFAGSWISGFHGRVSLSCLLIHSTHFCH